MSSAYERAGVNYRELDPFKRRAQQVALSTLGGLARLGIAEKRWSRGESAYVQRLPGGLYMAHVEEGLGTKNLVTDAMYGLTGDAKWYYYTAQCAAAMILNDIITVGARPSSLAMHLAVGDGDWLKDSARTDALLEGWAHACILAQCAMGGGETPALPGIVNPETVVFAGSAVGFMTEDQLIRSTAIRAGDAIVIFESSGIHANGLTLARLIAEGLPDGYLTRMPDGMTYGEALLAPVVIYQRVLEACQNAGVSIHYAINVTGHGWRKLMRANKPFTYVIDHVPEPPPVFGFMQESHGISDYDMYGDLNMGAGFAVIVPKGDVGLVIDAAIKCKIGALDAGRVEEGEKRVLILPKGLEFKGETLEVR